MTFSPGNNARLSAAFVAAARSYWLSVFPRARREIRHWRDRARTIPDPALRKLALDTQRGKRGNLEGAVAFATFVPDPYRAIIVRTIAAFQVAFDYLDTLAEQPNPDPIANGRQLNHALLAAAGATENCRDYYLHQPVDDGGYLKALVGTSAAGLALLPSFDVVADLAANGVLRIVEYQTYNHGDAHGSHSAFDEWSQRELDLYTTSYPDADLRVCELSAAAGSSLPFFALIAAASVPHLHRHDAVQLEEAYHPLVGGVGSLLDSLVDQDEDDAPGQNQLFSYYTSPEEIPGRLAQLVRRAAQNVRRLPDGYNHTLIFAAMVSYYVTSQKPNTTVCAATKLICEAIGYPMTPMTWIFRARRNIGRG